MIPFRSLDSRICLLSNDYFVLLSAVDSVNNLVSCINQRLSLCGSKDPLTDEIIDLIYKSIKHIDGRFGFALIELIDGIF